MSILATREDWGRFMSEYQTGLMASVPTASGFNDYIKQVCYLGSLQYFYRQYYDDWDNMPDTFSDTLPCYTGTYYSARDNQYHTSAIFYVCNKNGGIIAASDEFILTAEFSDYVMSFDVSVYSHPDTDLVGIGWQSNSDTYQDTYTYTIRQIGNYFGKLPNPNIPVEIPYSITSYSREDHGECFLYRNTGMYSLDNVITSHNVCLGNGCMYVPFTWDDINKYAPWDYYNNEILPSISPENAVFPNGYHLDPYFLKESR